MSANILQIKRSVGFEDDIISHQYHTYTPYSTAFSSNDEMRITIQSQDLYVLPSDSYLQIEFTPEKRDGTDFGMEEAFFTYNFISFMFSEMRYELNGFEIDRCKKPAITSNMKCMIACKESDKKIYDMLILNSQQPIEKKTYSMILPLRFVFGFCDDFNKIILNCKHELILVRNRSDVDVFTAATDLLKLTMNKIHWKVPHITLSDKAKLVMLKTVSHNDSLSLAYRSWDLYELPFVPQTTRHSWSVKTTTQVTKPRFVVVAFQTNRNLVPLSDASLFDSCNISNVKLYMNNERYPYDDWNLDFANKNYHELYYALTKIQRSYYNDNVNPLNVSYESFALRPLFAFDCSRTDESIKSTMVDIRIEIEANKNIPGLTSAYCLIIHDNLVRYSPFTSIVHRVV
ncbi:hexon [Mayetiola barley midge adintovirus]|uniref:hexon n=1 Tax=Mayetiola barley midge adintovirus TaxID=2609858 RepID=UPI002481D86A|nr:hexon [Mayetiola barley midge adintovirus]DAC81328.1 TPA_asm: hexon [Mayetiola barley midge adintovirus]